MLQYSFLSVMMPISCQSLPLIDYNNLTAYERFILVFPYHMKNYNVKKGKIANNLWAMLTYIYTMI